MVEILFITQKTILHGAVYHAPCAMYTKNFAVHKTQHTAHRTQHTKARMQTFTAADASKFSGMRMSDIRHVTAYLTGIPLDKLQTWPDIMIAPGISIDAFCEVPEARSSLRDIRAMWACDGSLDLHALLPSYGWRLRHFCRAFVVGCLVMRTSAPALAQRRARVLAWSPARAAWVAAVVCFAHKSRPVVTLLRR